MISGVYTAGEFKGNDWQGFNVGHNHIVNSTCEYYHEPQYSRDNEVGVAHKVKLPKKQPQFSQTTMGQYWLGKIKPKQAFRST